MAQSIRHRVCALTPETPASLTTSRGLLDSRTGQNIQQRLLALLSEQRIV